MAPLLAVLLAVAGMVVLDSPGRPGVVPIADQNPFKDVKLPESSSGSASGQAHGVPTSATQGEAGQPPTGETVRARGGAVANAVPLTEPGTTSKVDFSGMKPEPEAAQAAAAPLPAGVAMPVSLAPGVRDPGRPQQGRVELTSARTASGTEFRNPDGTHTSDVSMGQQRFRNTAGDWVGIDTTLAADGKGRFHSKATEQPVDIAGSADDAQLAQVDLGDGASVGFGLDGAAATKADINGFTASFAGVRAQSDLKLYSTAAGLVEVVVLKSADAPASWTFPLNLRGLTASMDDYGQVQLLDKAGVRRGLIPQGWMQDSGTSGAAGGPAMSTGVTYGLVDGPGKGQVSLRVDLDRAWLAAPERVYPVQVDPPITWLNPGADDTYVSSLHPSTVYSSQWDLKNGVYLSDVYRSYVHFDGQPQLTNANVLGVDVYLYNWLSAVSCTPSPVSLSEVTQSWDGTTMPWPGASIGSVVAQKSFAHSYNTACAPDWEDFSDPRLTALVGAWADGVKQNTGLAIQTSNTDGAAFKSFYSASCLCNPADPSTDYRPHMQVTWSPYGAQYSWPSGSPQWSTNLTANTPGQITVRVKNTGQATWPANGNVKLSYHVYDASGATELVHQGHVTNLPTAVARNQTVDLAATVDPLPAGNYLIYFDMEDAGTSWFSAQGITTLGMQAQSAVAAAPQVTNSTPPNGQHVGTLRPVLGLTGSGSGLSYEFQICDQPDAASGACWGSGGLISSASWKVPAYALQWGKPYYWRGRISNGTTSSGWTPPITVAPDVAAPLTSQHFGADPYVPTVSSVTPLIGNYLATTTDVSVAGVGPALALSRTYNSRNPTVGMFGAGWTAPWDMNVAADDAGEGNLVVRYPDGRQGRFGRNWDGSYASQDGYYSVVQAPSPQVASFTAPDSSSSLGDADTGQAWQVLSGVWGVSGNNAYLASAGAGSRSVAVMNAPADGLIRFTAPTTQDKIGVAFRVQDADNMWMLYLKPSTSTLVLAKRAGGTETTVATFANACCAASDTYAVAMSGPSLTVYRNDRVVGSASDPQFATSTRAGVYASTTGSGRLGSVVMVADAVRDSFTRANASTSLAITDSGEPWQSGGTYGVGTWGVTGNAAYLATAAGNRNVVTTPAAADGSFSFTEPTAQAGLGLAFRYADASNYWRLVAQPAAGTWQLVKRVGGVETTVATSAAGTCCTGTDTLVVTTNGPRIAVLRGGTQILSASDTDVLHGTRAGPFAESTGSGRIDDVALTAATTLTDKTGTGYTFRSDGRLAQVIDVAGRAETLTYDDNAQLTTVANAATGRALTVTWSGGHVATVSTPTVAAHSGPLTWTYGYSGDQLTTVTGPQSTSPTTYEYAFNGRLGKTTLPNGHIDAIIGYNSDGTVGWREDGLSNRTTFAVLQTSPTTVVRVTDPRNFVEDWEYSAQGQLIRHSGASGTRRFAYNTRGFLAQVTDENGNIVQTDTDDRGNVLARRTARMNLFGTLWTNTEYYGYYFGPPGDPRSNLQTTYRDARSASPTDNTYLTFNTFNTFGEVASTTFPATSDFPSGRTESWTYSNGTEAAIGGGVVPRGLPVAHTDPRGKVTTFGYDAKGDLRRDQDPAGLVHDYTYDELGRRLTSKETSDTYPSGLTTTFAYSKLSQIATVTEPGVANLVSGTTHTPVTTNTYDANGNLTVSVAADSTGGDGQRKTTYTYDGDDRLIWRTDGADSFDWATYGTTYDANGNVATSRDPDGTITAYTYTGNNQLATTTLKDFVDDPVAGTTPRDLVLESRAYDPAGRLASVTDAVGRTTQFTYWLDDLPRRAVLQGYRPPDLVNGVLSGPGARDVVLDDLTYDAAGNLIKEITGGGAQTVTADFDAAGRMNRTTVDPDGLARTSTYTYDAADDVTSVVAGAAGTSDTRRTDYGYDNASRLSSETVYGDGTATYVTSYQREQRGYVTSVTDPRGYGAGGALDPAYTTNFVTDAAGRLVQTIEPSIQVEENGGTAAASRPSAETGYDTFGDVTQSRGTRNNVTSTTYNTLGRPYQSFAPSYTPPGGSAVTPTQKWTFDANGNLVTYTDPMNQVTTTVYDKLGRPVSVTDPKVTGASSAGVTRLLYDDADNLRTTVDQDGAWTWYAYDDLDRVWATTQTERSGQATFTTYTDHDDAGNTNKVLTWANVPTQAAWTGSYDAAGGLVDAHDELGKLTHYGYDLSGQLASVTDPAGRQTRFAYDRAGRLTTAAQYSPSDALLRSSSTGYDAAGNATSGTDPAGHVTTTSYDALNLPRTTTVPVATGSSITSSAGYDAAGNRTRLTDGKGNITVSTFNSLGLPEKTIEPSTTAYPAAADRTWTTSYNAAGLATSTTDPGGVTVTGTYDQLGRLTGESGAGGGAAAASASYGYDLAGQLTSASHPTGTETFAYDDRGLLTGSAGPAGNATFGYDADGRMTSRTDIGATAGFGYNARGDLTSFTTVATGTTAALTYTDADQLATVTYASGDANSTVRTFHYDDLGRTTSDTLAKPSGTLRGQSYGYDDDDNLTSTTISPAGVAGAGTQSYGYDQAGRLTSYVNQANATTTYGWDAAGNRTAVNGATATFDARNRLTSDGAASYGYTARGTLSTRTAGSTTTSTTYDALGQLTGETTGPATTSYAYDALGRIATRNGAALSYAGTEPEPVLDTSYAYTHTPDGATVAVSSWAGGWDTFSNVHGDLAAAATATATSLADSRSYDPFGVPTTAGITGIEIGYQGSWTDPTTGRVDAEARWYSPGTGTFGSRDTYPLPWTGTAADNRYTYAGANPVSYSDTTGYYSDTTYTPRLQCHADDCVPVLRKSAKSKPAAPKSARPTPAPPAPRATPAPSPRPPPAPAPRRTPATSAAAGGRSAAAPVPTPVGIQISWADWIAATPKPSASPPSSRPSSFNASPLDTTPDGGLPIAAPAPGTDPGGPAATYTPPPATDFASLNGYADNYANLSDVLPGSAGSGAGTAGSGGPPGPMPPDCNQDFLSVALNPLNPLAPCNRTNPLIRIPAICPETGLLVQLKPCLSLLPDVFTAKGGGSKPGSGASSGSGSAAPVTPLTTVLGMSGDLEKMKYIWIASDGRVGTKSGFNILNKVGTQNKKMAKKAVMLGYSGPGSWNWGRNQQFLDDALARGDEIITVTNPYLHDYPIYERGNAYQRELDYLKKKGYSWEPAGPGEWRLVRDPRRPK